MQSSTLHQLLIKCISDKEGSLLCKVRRHYCTQEIVPCHITQLFASATCHRFSKSKKYSIRHLTLERIA
uniref:Uncharacterized protein n=1 Tax=Manihot esculenta TaxID=3983 RepID=A0A2C9U679_MANES